jgi:cytochrome c-type biogenesis protein CcmH
MRASLLIFCLLMAAPAMAVTIEKPLSDPVQEQVARNAIGQLKCVVCEGQALGDSDATFAREMRDEIRRMAAGGKSEKEILDYFRSRYGARILLTPPVEADTLPLWLAPLFLVAIGGLFLWRATRRRAA